MSNLYGDWNKIKKVLDKVEKQLPSVMEYQVEKSAEYLKESIKDYITNQEGNWASLDPSTIEMKNGDTTILIETGELVDSIDVTPNGNNRYVVSATGQRNQEVLHYHEYGTLNMVARPVVKPVFDREKAKVVEDCKHTLREVID